MNSKDIFAFIGTREPSKLQLKICSDLIIDINSTTHRIVSGCADGIDCRSLCIANSFGIETIGALPWNTYNAHVQKYCDALWILGLLDEALKKRAYDSVFLYHPSKNLSQGAIKLHARNYLIIHWAKKVYAFLGTAKGGGGTGQGIRLCYADNIPVIVYDYNGVQLSDAKAKELVNWRF